MSEVSVKIPTKEIRRFRFAHVPAIDMQNGEATKVWQREINGHLLIKLSDAKKFTDKSDWHIRELIERGSLTPYTANGMERKSKKTGGSRIYFDLYEWLDLEEQ